MFRKLFVRIPTDISPNTLTLKEIFTGSGIAIFILLSLIQIAPIKINPWTWIAQRIGRAVNGELISKVDSMEQQIIKLEDKADERDATLCRTRFLRFGDEIMHGVPHSKEHYDQTLADIDTYETFCKSHPNYINNVAKVTIRHIKNKYEEHLTDDSFL